MAKDHEPKTTEQPGNRPTAMDALRAVEAKRPVLQIVLGTHGKEPLSLYAEGFRGVEQPSVQSAADFIAVARSYAAETLGEDKAASLEATLRKSHVILTADHFGPLNLHITTQGDIAYALGKRPGQAFLVAAFGDVPLNNINYTRGVSLAREVPGEDGKPRTVKTNLYPGSMSATLVSAAPKVTEAMVQEGRKQIDSQRASGQISHSEYDAQKRLLDLYGSSEAQAQPDLAHQLPIVNAGIWDSMFTPEARATMPDMVFLEMETIVGRLLEADLQQTDAPVAQMLFGDPALRSNLVTQLDGQYGCWDRAKLTAVVEDDPKSWAKPEKQERAAKRREAMAGAGTMFFWGVDAKGRRVNLSFNDGQTQLVGVDDSGEGITIDFTPEGIREALRQKKILPSLFTSFTSVALLRGMKCYGGFMQTDYLTNMREGVAAALETTANQARFATRRTTQPYDMWTEQIRGVPTENYSTGMTFAVARYEDGSVKPAGAMEMMAKGGLTQDDLTRIRNITLAESNLLGIPDVYRTVYRPEERDTDLAAMTLHDVYDELADKLVTISLI